MPIPWLAIAITVGLQVVSYLLMPKPRAGSNAIREAEAPTAEADKPISVVFGTVLIKDPNVLWYGDKSTKRYEVDV